LFFAEPGNINIETKWTLSFMELKSQDQKNQELYEEYKKINSRFRNDNLTLLEQKFNAIKSNNTKAIDSHARQDSNTKRRYLYTNFA
jgi:hypothetical protein